MADGTRETTCGHYPYKAKGLCNKCYMAAWHGPKKPKVIRQTTCGHMPFYAKDMCEHCYNTNPSDDARERRRAATKAWREANKERHRAMQKAWREANAERKAAYAKAWAEANTQQHQNKKAAWREANREHERAYTRAWAKANPEKTRNNNNQYRARKYAAPCDFTHDQWLAVLAEFDGHCAYCERDDLPLVMEHMTPLSRRGGHHTAENIVPSCAPCNNRKSSKTALEFAGWSVPPRRVNGESG